MLTSGNANWKSFEQSTHPRSCVAPYQCLVKHITGCRTGAAELVVKRKSRRGTCGGHLEALPAGAKSETHAHWTAFLCGSRSVFFLAYPHLELLYFPCFSVRLFPYLLMQNLNWRNFLLSSLEKWSSSDLFGLRKASKNRFYCFVFSSSLNMVLWDEGLPTYMCL